MKKELNELEELTATSQHTLPQKEKKKQKKDEKKNRIIEESRYCLEMTFLIVEPSHQIGLHCLFFNVSALS